MLLTSDILLIIQLKLQSVHYFAVRVLVAHLPQKLSCIYTLNSFPVQTLSTGQIRQYWPKPLPFFIFYDVWVMYKFTKPLHTVRYTLHTLLGYIRHYKLIPLFFLLLLWVMQSSSQYRHYTRQTRQYWPMPLPFFIFHYVWVMCKLTKHCTLFTANYTRIDPTFLVSSVPYF